MSTTNPLASVSGVASGIQWRDLIDQLIAAEAAPANSLQSKIDAAGQRTSVWNSFNSQVSTLQTAAAALSSTALRTNKVALGLAAGSGSPLSSASATVDAAVGTHTVRVLGLASAETLSGDVFSTRSSALGLSGEFRINGKRIEILATDSLDTIVKRFNDANVGGATGVTASVLTTGSAANRLVLSSTKTGAAGIDLVDGASAVLQSMGLLDNTTAIKTATTNGAKSDAFADSATAVATLLGFTSPPASGSVTMGGVNVTLDLASMSLTDVASAINTAAAAAGRGVSAQVIADGSKQRLEIHGATSFTDANSILQSLGVLEGGRSAVTQQIASAALGDAGATPASAGTLLTSLWSQGAAAVVQAGDSLTISGTRADGSTFSFDVTIGAGDTLQTLVGRLNSAVDGFKLGTRTATASISANGELVVSDDSGGESRLGLNIVAHNENGGTLDFGAFGVTQAGRSRVINAAADAELEIDGSYLTSSSNTITNSVPGLTLNLAAADPNTVATVTVSRDIDAAVTAVQGLVDAYNSLASFVDAQLTPPPTGGTAAPLYNDSTLRSMRQSLRGALASSLDTTVIGGYSRLADIGIEIDKTGRYTLDSNKLRSALQNGGDAVSRLFGLYGTSSVADLTYVDASKATSSGTWTVNITQPPAAADVTGAGFAGTYVDDGSADTLSVRDLSSNRTYSVALSNGMTLSQIVDALTAEFAKPLAHTVAAGNALFSNPAGTVAADDNTAWSALTVAGGTSPAVTAGDVITIAGNRTDGSSFLTSLSVSAGGTLGELRNAVQSALGSAVDVQWVNGKLTATAKTPGSSSFTLSVTSDNAGGGSLDFGAFGTTQQGRGTAPITALDNGGQLQLVDANAGAAAGFEISFAAGGADGSASLGLSAGTYVGTDVAGTIGGFAASGSGRVLTGATGTPIDGLLVSYTGTGTGAVGTVSFSRGMAARVSDITADLLGTSATSIKAVTDRISGSVSGMQSRIDTINARLDRHRTALIAQFTAMEQAIARAQSQSAWLTTQLAQFTASKKS